MTDGYLPDRYTASAAAKAGSVAALLVKPQRRGGDVPYGLGAGVFDPGAIGLDAKTVVHTGEILHFREEPVAAVAAAHRG